MELVTVTLGDYPLYEELLIRRDNLDKEACLYGLRYEAVFGRYIEELFSLKIDAIRLKKLIRYAQMAVNRGRTPDFDDIEGRVSGEMSDYKIRLQQMIREHEAARNAKTVSEQEYQKIRTIYRNIAKLIHPDINSFTSECEELTDLWNRVCVAYKCNSLKDLEELEVLVNGVLAAKGLEHMNVVIPDINEKIEQLKAEIRKITTTDPYMYKYFLDDEDAVEEKTGEYNKEIEEYYTYIDNLRDMYKGLGGEWNVR